MQESTTREKILKKVRSALIQKNQNLYPKYNFTNVFPPNEDVPELSFAQHLVEAGGNFIFCENKTELAESLVELSLNKNWNILYPEEAIFDLLKDVKFPRKKDSDHFIDNVCIISCECLVARTGSVLISSASNYNKLNPFSSGALLVYATTRQLIYNLGDAFNFMKVKYGNTLPSSITFITGIAKATDFESRSTNTEKHPQELFLFLVDEIQKN
jgi:L-lactate dehydrogenase complex protein LldG